jgi:hypothetical protein
VSQEVKGRDPNVLGHEETTIQLKKSDYDYYEQYGMYLIKKGHYEKHPPSEKYITKRCGGKKEDYWGFLGEDGEEYKIKWIEN